MALGVALALIVDLRLAAIVAAWFGLWALNAWMAERAVPGARILVPVIFGATLLLIWELAVRQFEVSAVILPAPSAVAARFSDAAPTLWADFVQTIIKGAMSGYLIGCGAAILTAIAIDRSRFLQRGLLPVGNFIAALPIVGTAPILVMWFGFGWQSKAAVVVLMVFFPMLVNMVQGLRATEAMQRDLMHTYAASYTQSLMKLRLPAALPFLFNGLKICSTLALIGAIVAEFFGSPTVGMGFRIKIEVGRLAMDMVWAEITIAALAGSGLYGLIVLIERRMTFWHPSQRQ
ncbi:MAG: ABC transporter permease [Pseudomonadota bacterium]